MYKILLMNPGGTYRYHRVLGTKVPEIFDAEDLEQLEAECIKLLYEYNASQIIPVANVQYDVDLLWEDPENVGSYFPGLVVPGVESPNPSEPLKFKILTKLGEDKYKFHMVREEVMITSKTGTVVGSGKFREVEYETEDIKELEAESLELLKKYPYTSVVPVVCFEFVIDLLWTNIEWLTIAMQQKLYDIATAQQIIDTVRGGN